MTNKKIRVLIVDDHPVFVETLKAGLEAAGLDVVGTATRAEDGHQRAQSTEPDVALLDVEMPEVDGLELARRLHRACPTARIVMLTGSKDPGAFAKAMDAGASGYLLKDASLHDVVTAVRRAAAGEVVVPEQTVHGLLRARAPGTGLGQDLTKRELEVLALLAAGSDVRAIGRALGLTWHTTRSYVKNVLAKLGASSQLEAVAKASRLGILGPNND